MSAMRRAGIVLVLAVMGAGSALAHPGSGIAVDDRGQVYFADTGAGVWKIDANRKLTKINATKFHWLAMDQGGKFAHAAMPTSNAGEFVRVAGDPALLLSSDFPVAIGPDGSFFHSEPSGRDGVQLVRWTPSGARSVFTTLPKKSGGEPLRWINGLASGPDGSLYFTENAAVRRVDARGQFSTVVSNVKIADCIEVPGNEPSVGVFLRGLAVAPDGTIVVAAAGCGAVLRIGPSKQLTPVHRTAAPWAPTAVALSGMDVYVLEYLHTAIEDRRAWIPRVRLLRADGTSEILATVERASTR